MKAIMDREAIAMLLEFPRRDSFPRDEQIVQPTWAGKAYLEGSVKDAGGLIE